MIWKIREILLFDELLFLQRWAFFDERAFWVLMHEVTCVSAMVEAVFSLCVRVRVIDKAWNESFSEISSVFSVSLTRGRFLLKANHN